MLGNGNIEQKMIRSFIAYCRILLVFCCFGIFGLICLLGNIVFLPIIALKLQKYLSVCYFCRDLVYFSWRFFLFCTRVLGVVQLDFKNFHSLGKKGEIIIANHPSLLDVVFLLAHVRHLNCIIKAKLQHNFFLFGAILAGNYIPNTQDDNCLDRAIEALRRGECLLIFPEGTRSGENGVLLFHKAASYIAIHGAVILTPLFIHNTPKALQKNSIGWDRMLKSPLKYSITINPSLLIESFAPAKSNPLRVRELNNYLNHYYQKEFYE